MNYAQTIAAYKKAIVAGTDTLQRINEQVPAHGTVSYYRELHESSKTLMAVVQEIGRTITERSEPSFWEWITFKQRPSTQNMQLMYSALERKLQYLSEMLESEERHLKLKHSIARGQLEKEIADRESHARYVEKRRQRLEGLREELEAVNKIIEAEDKKYLNQKMYELSEMVAIPTLTQSSMTHYEDKIKATEEYKELFKFFDDKEALEYIAMLEQARKTIEEQTPLVDALIGLEQETKQRASEHDERVYQGFASLDNYPDLIFIHGIRLSRFEIDGDCNNYLGREVSGLNFRDMFRIALENSPVLSCSGNLRTDGFKTFDYWSPIGLVLKNGKIRQVFRKASHATEGYERDSGKHDLFYPSDVYEQIEFNDPYCNEITIAQPKFEAVYLIPDELARTLQNEELTRFCRHETQASVIDFLKQIAYEHNLGFYMSDERGVIKKTEL